MRYKRIVVELVVGEDEADTIISQLNRKLNQLEEDHDIYGGDIEAVSFKGPARQRRSALAHTLAAGGTVAMALRNTRRHVGNAVRAVI